MNLSNRLKAVATLVCKDSRVIDVGCDHAYLDIYLTLYNNNSCIATDINKNALEIAKNNIKKYNLEDKIETKLTDGLLNLEIKESDTIVISGMGTHTILEILKTNKLSDTLIISSNNDIEMLRTNVVNLGYYIDCEIFIIDKNKPYVIIKFKKGTKKYSKRDLKYGPYLKNNIKYINYLIKKYNLIIKNIGKNKLLLKFKYKFLILKLKIMLYYNTKNNWDYH